MVLSRSLLLIFGLASLGFIACSQVDKSASPYIGKTYYLAADGDDANDGKRVKAAWGTWSHASSALAPGDMLVVLPGIYDLGDGGITLSGLGPCPSGNPTRIVSQQPGTVTLKATAINNAEWQPLDNGLYQLAYNDGTSIVCGFTGETYLHNYRSLQDLKDGRNKTEGYHRGGEYFNGPSYGLAYDEGNLYLKPPPGVQSPAGVQLVRATNPLVSIHNSPELIFDGFQLQGRSTAINIDQDSPGVAVHNCLILAATYGVMTDADNTLVAWCEFTVPGLDGFNEKLMEHGTYIYYFMKERGLEGGLVYSKKVPAPRFLEARYNYIHRVFDGDGLGQFDDSTIHHSIYHHCFDNAVEFEPNVKGKAGANLRFYLNRVSGYSRGYLSHQQNGVSREQAEQGGWHMEGPHYVHHNVIVADGNNKKNGWKPWTVIKSRPWNNNIAINYAHNLIYARTHANLFWSMPEWTSGLAGMHWQNNVILMPEGVVESPLPFTGTCNALFAPSPNPAFTGEYGLYVTDLSALKYRDNKPSVYPSPLRGSPLTDHAERINAPWMHGFQNETIGPFAPNEAIDSGWPRPAARTFAPRDTVSERLYPLQ